MICRPFDKHAEHPQQSSDFLFLIMILNSLFDMIQLFFYKLTHFDQRNTLSLAFATHKKIAINEHMIHEKDKIKNE